MASQDDILTISDIAGLFKVAEKTVYGLAQKGELPGFKVGGQWRFRRTAIETWIDERTVATGIQPTEDVANPASSSQGV